MFICGFYTFTRRLMLLWLGKVEMSQSSELKQRMLSYRRTGPKNILWSELWVEQNSQSKNFVVITGTWFLGRMRMIFCSALVVLALATSQAAIQTRESCSPYVPGEPGGEWSAEELKIVRRKVCVIWWQQWITDFMKSFMIIALADWKVDCMSTRRIRNRKHGLLWGNGHVERNERKSQES